LAAYAAFISLSSVGNAWSASIDWTGAYAGVNAGGGVAHADMRTSVEAPGMYFLPDDIAQVGDAGAATANPFLFAGGAQAGYNLQSGTMVYGLEADLSAFELNGSRTVTQEYNTAPGMHFALEQSVRTDWLLTVRPRVGVAISDFFIYGTAGVAVTRIKYTATYTDDFNPPNSALETGSISKTQVGWTAGAGCEYALSERWSVKGEYLYADFGRVSGGSVLTAPPPNTDNFSHSVSLQTHLLRVGLNFKFYGLGFGLTHPPAAKTDRKWRYDDPVDAPIYTF
jgi:outer membrane immunogenic protein